MSKTCKWCGQLKPLSEFYRDGGMKDGHVNKCKACYCGGVKAHRRSNPHVQEADRNRYYKTKHLTAETRAAYHRKFELEHPIRYRANTAVNNAIKDGKLCKPANCSNCGRGDCVIHGHHDDYAKPLDVRWLCAQCHQQWHQENGPGVNGD